MKKTLILVCLFLITAIAVAGQVDQAPKLNGTLQSDGKVVLTPDGWAVTNMEKTESGIRFYRIRDNQVDWVDYKTPFTVVIGGSSPNPPAPNIPVISSNPQAKTKVGDVFTYQIQASNNPTSYDAVGLPDGITVNKGNGLISGIATKDGISQVTISAINSYGTGNLVLTLTVTSVVPPDPAPEPSKIRVLLSYPAAIGDLTEDQRQVVFSVQSGSVRDYCSQHSVTDGAQPAVRAFAIENFTVADVSDSWKPLLAAAEGKPGLIVQAEKTNKITKFEFPKDKQDALAKIKTITEPVSKGVVIDENNFQKFVGMQGVGYGYIRGPPPVGYQKFSDAYPLIPRSQWKGLVQQGQGTFLSDLIKSAKIKVKNQDGTPLCWAFASTSTVEVIRALQGQPYVELAPESIAGPLTNWRWRGGWGYEALEQLTKEGACASSFLDKPYSSNSRKWKTGWEIDCANHKVVAAWATIDDGNFDAVFTAVLLRLPVSIGLDWWAHQVMVCDPVVLDNGKYGVLCRNSWGDMPPDYPDGWFMLTEAKTVPSGSFACVSVGTSDKEMNDNQKGLVTDLVQKRQATVKKLIKKYDPQYSNSL